MELENHLNQNYPILSPIWHWVRVSFLNDYHRSFAVATISEINKLKPNRGTEFFMILLCGSAMDTTLDSFKITDTKLHGLRKNYEDTKTIWKHFQVEDLIKSTDKARDLVHGEGHSERIRNSLRRINLKNKIDEPK